jgi:hypothetical protein
VAFRVVDEEESEKQDEGFNAPSIPFRYQIPEPASQPIREAIQATSNSIDSGDPPGLHDFHFIYNLPKYANTEPRITAVWSDFLVDSEKRGDFNDVVISKTNLVKRFHDLLFVEEKQMEVDIRHYEINGAEIQVAGNTLLHSILVPGLLENRPAILFGDKILVSHNGTVYQVYILPLISRAMYINWKRQVYWLHSLLHCVAFSKIHYLSMFRSSILGPVYVNLIAVLTSSRYVGNLLRYGAFPLPTLVECRRIRSSVKQNRSRICVMNHKLHA